MVLILNIEVTGKTGFISVAVDGVTRDIILNDNPMEHATFLQAAIKEILDRNGYNIKNIHAIALSNGPGSYTGLRVGMASAKGLSFALNIPLITINTLELMASSLLMSPGQGNSINFVNTISANTSSEGNEPLQQGSTESPFTGKEFLICPMVDARRMDVFFGLFDNQNHVVVAPSSATITTGFMQEQLDNYSIIFTGSGAAKLQKIIRHPNSYFAIQPLWDKAFGQLSYFYYNEKIYSDITHSEPFYCKEFYDAAAPRS